MMSPGKYGDTCHDHILVISFKKWSIHSKLMVYHSNEEQISEYTYSDNNGNKYALRWS